MNLKELLKKIMGLIITLFIVSLATFLGFELLTGDSATVILGIDATPEKLIELRHQLGLDRPLYIRYISYIWGILHGSLGTSYIYKESVAALIQQKLLITSTLVIMALLIIFLLSFPISILSARYRKSPLGSLITVINQINMSIPPFFLGIIITYIFGFIFKCFIPGKFVGYDNPLKYLAYMFFPALAIAIPKASMTIKLMSNSIIDESKNDYVRVAFSRGNSEAKILFSHVLKNAVMPVITFLGMLPASMIASSVVIEQVFAVPGIGNLLITSIYKRDYPVVQAIIMLIACVVVILNFTVDILYRCIDPRLRRKEEQ